MLLDFDDENHQWLTYTAAARRVDRSRRTLHRWKANGMPTVMVNGENYVHIDVLLAWWRECLQRWAIRKGGSRIRDVPRGSELAKVLDAHPELRQMLAA